VGGLRRELLRLLAEKLVYDGGAAFRENGPKLFVCRGVWGRGALLTAFGPLPFLRPLLLRLCCRRARGGRRRIVEILGAVRRAGPEAEVPVGAALLLLVWRGLLRLRLLLPVLRRLWLVRWRLRLGRRPVLLQLRLGRRPGQRRLRLVRRPVLRRLWLGRRPVLRRLRLGRRLVLRRLWLGWGSVVLVLLRCAFLCLVGRRLLRRALWRFLVLRVVVGVGFGNLRAEAARAREGDTGQGKDGDNRPIGAQKVLGQARVGAGDPAEALTG
jgi:hypothetical protein